MNNKHNNTPVNNNSLEIKQEDIPLYKKLGLRPRTAKSFYAKDIVEFFKQRDKEVSPKESEALQIDLSLLIQFMENERIPSWEACDKAVWEKLLIFSYIDLAYEQSQGQVKSFYKTILTLTTWIENKYDSLPSFSSWVKEIEEQHEEEVFDSVRVLELYRGQIENAFLTAHEDIRRETLIQEAGVKNVTEGVFEVTDMTKDTMETTSLLTKKTFKVHLSKYVVEEIRTGTSFIGVLKEGENKWEILTLDRVFPPTAKPYLYKSIGIKY